MKGIEPSYAAWEAAVLPLNYTRKRIISDFWLRLARYLDLIADGLQRCRIWSGGWDFAGRDGSPFGWGNSWPQ